MNFVPVKIGRNGDEVGPTLGEGVTIPLPGRDVELADGAPVTVGIRPEHAEIGEAAQGARRAD